MAVEIFEAGPLAAPVAYTLPGAQVLVPRSVSAVIDGTGASGAFLACCSFYGQNGNLIARVPTGAAIAAGSTAEVTWAPFLRAQAASVTPSGTSLPWGMAACRSLTIASGAGFTAINFDTTLANRQFGSSGDGVVTLGNQPGGVKGLILNAQGVYRVSFHATGNTNGAVAAGAVTEIACDFDVGDIIAGSYLAPFNVTSGGVAKQSDAGTLQMLDLDPANYPIPNEGKVTVRQNSTVNVIYDIIVAAVLVSTITDPNIF